MTALIRCRSRFPTRNSGGSGGTARAWTSPAGRLDISLTPAKLRAGGAGGKRSRLDLDQARSAGELASQRPRRRPVDHLAAELEARAVAGAVPGAVGRVPADDAAHVRADGRDGVDPALLVAIGRDIVAVDLEDGGVAGGELVEALGLAREIARDEVGGD